MTKFVKLTSPINSEPLFVNADNVHIVRARPVGQGAQPQSTLFFEGLSENSCVEVLGTPAEVAATLAG